MMIGKEKILAEQIFLYVTFTSLYLEEWFASSCIMQDYQIR